jgi:lipoyl synthase
VGLGEQFDEVLILLDDMKAAPIDVVSIGQYLKPSAEQTEVVKVYSNADFVLLEKEVSDRKFLAWEVGPFVRSSYMAEGTLAKVEAERKRRING